MRSGPPRRVLPFTSSLMRSPSRADAQTVDVPPRLPEDVKKKEYCRKDWPTSTPFCLALHADPVQLYEIIKIDPSDATKKMFDMVWGRGEAAGWCGEKIAAKAPKRVSGRRSVALGVGSLSCVVTLRNLK